MEKVDWTFSVLTICIQLQAYDKLPTHLNVCIDIEHTYVSLKKIFALGD